MFLRLLILIIVSVKVAHSAALSVGELTGEIRRDYANFSRKPHVGDTDSDEDTSRPPMARAIRFIRYLLGKISSIPDNEQGRIKLAKIAREIALIIGTWAGVGNRPWRPAYPREKAVLTSAITILVQQVGADITWFGLPQPQQYGPHEQAVANLVQEAERPAQEAAQLGAEAARLRAEKAERDARRALRGCRGPGCRRRR